MEEKERIAVEVVECHLHDVPRPREAGKSVPDASSRKTSLRSHSSASANRSQQWDRKLEPAKSSVFASPSQMPHQQ
jgi:hypothetical protein